MIKIIFIFFLMILNNFSSLGKYNPSDLFEGDYENNELNNILDEMKYKLKNEIIKKNEYHKKFDIQYYDKYNDNNYEYINYNDYISSDDLFLLKNHKSNNFKDSKQDLKNALSMFYSLYNYKPFSIKTEMFKELVYYEKSKNKEDDEKTIRKNSLLSIGIKRYYIKKLQFYARNTDIKLLIAAGFVFTNFAIPFYKNKQLGFSNLKTLTTHIFGSKFINKHPYFNKWIDSAIFYLNKRHTKIFILDKYKLKENFFPQIINLFINSKIANLVRKKKSILKFISLMFLYEFFIQRKAYSKLENHFINDFETEKEIFKEKYYNHIDLKDNSYDKDEELELEIKNENISQLIKEISNESNKLNKNEIYNFMIDNQNNNDSFKEIILNIGSIESMQNSLFDIALHNGAYTFTKSLLLLKINDHIESLDNITISERLYWRNFLLKDLNHSFLKRFFDSINRNVLEKYFEQNPSFSFYDYQSLGLCPQIECIKTYLYLIKQINIVDKTLINNLINVADSFSSKFMAIKEIFNKNNNSNNANDIINYKNLIKSYIITYNELRIVFLKAIRERNVEKTNEIKNKFFIPEITLSDNIMYFNT